MDTEERRAVTIFSSIPTQPIRPKVHRVAKRRGRLPKIPAFNDLNIKIRSRKIEKNANNKE